MNYIQVRSYSNYINAHISLGMLQEAGINCHLENENIITIHPFLSPAIGGMKLMVHKAQVERAIDLLKETGEMNNDPLKSDPYH